MSILEKCEVITDSPLKTRNLGERLGRALKRGDIISLTGELSSGKTTLIQGIARGLSIKEPVNSPSFSLLNIYKGGRIPLYHFDLYRIAPGEDIGFDELFNSPSISVIEWGEKAQNFLPGEYLKISLSHIAINKRRILFIPKGKYFIELVKDIMT